MTDIRILLCEDQTLVRDGLRTILELQPGLAVVGEAADGEEAVRRALELRPDIALMDVQMPRRNGVEATALITAAHPDTRVIVLTTFDYDDYVFDAVKAGAMGYLLKDVPARELIDTMRAEVARAAVAAGAVVVNDVSGGLADPEMAATVAELGCVYVLSHWRGFSDVMTSRAVYDDVVAEVSAELRGRLDAVTAAGIAPERIVLDPGLGFAKVAEHDWALLAGLDRFPRTGARLGTELVGIDDRGDHVVATLRDVDRGETTTVTADYLVGTEGGSTMSNRCGFE